MTTQHVFQLIGGGLLFFFGLASVFTGWVPADQAIGFIVSGASVFGLTVQTAQLASGT